MTIIGVQIVGMAAASAHANAVTGTVSCLTDGSYTVSWRVANDYNLTETATSTGYTPDSAALSSSSVTIGSNGSGTISETGIPGTSTSASLSVRGVWSDGYYVTNSGSVSLAGSCLPSHAPAAPRATNGSCDQYSHQPQSPSVTIPTDAGVSYRLDGTIRSAGRYPVTAGSHTVTASSSSLQLTGQTQWPFTLTAAPADCNLAVVPVAPTITQSTCVTGSSTPSAPTLTLARTPGISYQVTPGGPYAAGESVTVTATASSGNDFRAPAADGWTYLDSTHETYRVTFAAAPTCLGTVTPQNPEIQQATCGPYGSATSPFLTLASTASISYTANPSGPYQAGQRVVVTATADSGDRFVAPAPSDWTYQDAGHETYAVVFDGAPTCVAPGQPSVVQSTCPATGTPPTVPTAPTIAFPSTVGVDYATSPGAPFQAGQTITVTATAQPGYQFSSDAPPGWHYVNPGQETRSLTFAAAPNCVQAVAPTFTDPSCTGPGMSSNGSYTIPGVTGVQYQVGGVDVTTGTHPVTGAQSVDVTAVALPGYTIAAPHPAAWPHAFPAPDFAACVESIVAAQVSFTDTSCSDLGQVVAGSYTVPDSTGVSYTIDGAAVPAGTYQANTGSTITILAAARTGFTLSGVTQWTHTFSAPQYCGLGVGGEQTGPPVSSGSGPTALTGAPIGQFFFAGIALLLLGMACYVGASLRRRRRPTT